MALTPPEDLLSVGSLSVMTTKSVVELGLPGSRSTAHLKGVRTCGLGRSHKIRYRSL